MTRTLVRSKCEIVSIGRDSGNGCQCFLTLIVMKKINNHLHKILTEGVAYCMNPVLMA